MKADYQSYAKAAQVCIVGLAIQLVLGIILLIYGVMDRGGHSAVTGAIAVLLGCAVWLTLAVVFDQHRRERIEAMEQEALDAAQQSSVFESAGEEIRANARRLDWMHRFLVPGVSIAVGAVLLVVAYLRFRSGSELVWPVTTTNTTDGTTDPFREPTLRGWAIAIGLGLGVVGFIFARFVSGMAKQKVWANLRGGAAYGVVASLVGLLLAAAHFAHLAGTDVALRYLQLVMPVLLALLGAEIFISMLLNLYRPRKRGETPRPAFDSPVLGFVSSPDEIARSIGGAISYQVGVDITGSWAYRLVNRSFLPLVVFGVGVLWLLSCLAVVGTAEQGLRVRMGKLVGAPLGPGLYLKLPWPLESIDRTAATDIGRIDLASAKPGDGVPALLWTNEHKTQEVYLIVQAPVRAGNARPGATAAPATAPAPGSAGGDGAAATAGTRYDVSYLAVEAPLRYRIRDLQAWETFATPRSRESLLRALAQRELMLAVSAMTEDDLLGAGRAKLNAELPVRVQQALDRVWQDQDGTWKGAGVEVVWVGVEGVHPSQGVAPLFEKVVGNDQLAQMEVRKAQAERVAKLTQTVGDPDRATTILALIDERGRLANAAQRATEPAERERLEGEARAKAAEVIELIRASGGQAAAMLARASSDRWARSAQEAGRAEAYKGLLAAFNANPDLFKVSRYLDTLRRELAETRLYIVPSDEMATRFNIDLKDFGGTGTNPFQSPQFSPK